MNNLYTSLRILQLKSSGRSRLTITHLFSTASAQVALCSHREMQKRVDTSTSLRHTRFECTLRLLVCKFKGHEHITTSPEGTAGSITTWYKQWLLKNIDEFECQDAFKFS